MKECQASKAYLSVCDHQDFVVLQLHHLNPAQGRVTRCLRRGDRGEPPEDQGATLLERG